MNRVFSNRDFDAHNIPFILSFSVDFSVCVSVWVWSEIELFRIYTFVSYAEFVWIKYSSVNPYQSILFNTSEAQCEKKKTSEIFFLHCIPLLFIYNVVHCCLDTIAVFNSVARAFLSMPFTERREKKAVAEIWHTIVVIAVVLFGIVKRYRIEATTKQNGCVNERRRCIWVSFVFV